QGEKHPDYTISLNNLACLYKDMGNYTAAEPLFLEAKNIRKEILGEKHPSYAISLNSLATLYMAMGNYTAAEPLYLESKNIRKEVLGEKHPSYATSLNNLAQLYQVMGNFTAAETLFIESKDIRKEILGEKHPDYANSLTNLAGLYKAMDNYSAAEPLFLEAMNICKEVLGEKHPDYASSLNNLAGLYQAMGNYPAAEALYIESKKIRKEALGEKHPSYAESLNNLAGLYKDMGNYSVAEPLYLECLEIINGRVNQNFAFLSEKEKEMYFKTKSVYFANFYSFSLKRKIENPEITKTVYNNVVKNKGLLLKSSTAMRTAILNSNDTALISQYQKWIALKKEISKLYSTQISKRKKNPEELEKQANVLEKELVKGSQVFNDFKKLQNLSWESVKNSLKPGEAAIEFLRFKSESAYKDTVIAKDTTGNVIAREERPKQSDSGDKIASTASRNDEIITYCALIVKPDSKYPEMVKLCEEKELAALLKKSGDNENTNVNNIYGTNQNANEALYKLVWQPMEKELEGVKTVYYSPDGLLHKISFSAIGKGKNTYLCDTYNLKQESSTGKVAMPENSLIDKNLTACIIGGIDYSADSSKNSIWQYLPGTLTEANAITTKLSEKKISVTTYTGKQSTELAFKNIYSKEGGNPTILHIATHGFFYPDPEKITKEEKTNEKVETGTVAFRGGNSGFGLWQFVKNKNPLMNSGLVFAGANNVWNQRFVGEGEDGVLTAQEVTQLDMTKTKLVVLSACETGLGDIKGSEGVYGLQRAFKMAG
ncbi:CHAT domain-containing protein, partial [bacterium]|nr:CHAT domain-containing protein [bacterium]